MSRDGPRAPGRSPSAREDPPRRIDAPGGGRVVRPRDIASVVYLGPDTRYIVELEAGGRLVVTQQNLATTSIEALEPKARLSA